MAHTDDEVLAHIHALKSAEPLFANRVGKHSRTLLDVYAATAAAAGPTNFDAINHALAREACVASNGWTTSGRGKQTRVVAVRALDRPEPDLHALAKALVALARQLDGEDEPA